MKEEYKFDHFKDIDEVMYYFNYWYNEDDIYSIDRYLSLEDFNYISNKYQELKKENEELQDNWNELKSFLINERETSISYQEQMGNNVCVISRPQLYTDTIIDKMNELERGERNE